MKRRLRKIEWIRPAQWLVLSVGLLSSAALVAAESVTCDDLEGLRPDSGANDFWDTSAHTTYSVQVEQGASASALSSVVATSATSGVTDIAKRMGLVIHMR